MTNGIVSDIFYQEKTSDRGVTAKEAVNLRQPLTITSPQPDYSKASRIVATPDYQKTLQAAADDYRFESLCHPVLLVY